MKVKKRGPPPCCAGQEKKVEEGKLGETEEECDMQQNESFDWQLDPFYAKELPPFTPPNMPHFTHPQCGQVPWHQEMIFKACQSWGNWLPCAA